MEVHRVLLDGDDAPVPAYEAVPTDRRGGIVVVHEAFGLTDYIHGVCAALAEDGFHAVAPNLFHRHGIDAISYDDLNEAKAVMAQLAADQIRADIRSAVQRLGAAGLADRSVGILGFCMGGSIACAIATEQAFGAAVTFYGAGIRQGRFGFAPLADRVPLLRTPWLGLYGDRDTTIPVADVEFLRSEAARAPVPTAVVRYPEAGHGFHCSARPAHFHQPSAADAWERTRDWFNRYLNPAGLPTGPAG